jgi:hypothetical protein
MKITEKYLKKIIRKSLHKSLQESMLQMGKDFFGSKERKAEVEKEHKRKSNIAYKKLIQDMHLFINNEDLNSTISTVVKKSDTYLLGPAFGYHFKGKIKFIPINTTGYAGTDLLKKEFFNYMSENGREKLLKFLNSLIKKIGPGLENVSSGSGTNAAQEQFLRVLGDYKRQFYSAIDANKKDLEKIISLNEKSINYIEDFKNKYDEQGFDYNAPGDFEKRATKKEFSNAEKAEDYKKLTFEKFEEKIISIAKNEYIRYNLIAVLQEILKSQISGLKISKSDDIVAQARVDKRNYSEVMKNNPGWFIVHYINAFTEKDYQDVFPGVLSWINYFGGKRSKDEFAGVAYHKDNKYLGDNIGRGTGTRDKLPRVGAILEGYVTAIYDGDVGSTTFSQSNPYGGKREESGFARYAGDMGDYSSQGKRLIMDLEKYKESVQGKDFLYNEGFIDNWQPTGIIADWEKIKNVYINNANSFYPEMSGKEKSEIVKELSSILLRIPLACQEKDMKIFDNNFNEINIKDFLKIIKDMIDGISNTLSNPAG